jgi:hypothetical protein
VAWRLLARKSSHGLVWLWLTSVPLVRLVRYELQSYIFVRQTEPNQQHQKPPPSPEPKPHLKPQPKPDPKQPPPQKTAWEQTVRYAKVTKDALANLAGCNFMGSFNVWTYCKPTGTKFATPSYDEAGMWPV